VGCSWGDVERLALALPEVEESLMWGQRAWKVKGKLFVWERPLRKSDLEALGDSAPAGPILGARVEHEGAKEVLLQSEPGVFFTTPHFDGHPSVLIQLARIAVDELEEIVIEAWLARAPKRLADAQLERLKASS
jgi:hypothetical protein